MSEVNSTTKATAVHNIICGLLRGQNTQNLNANKLRHYQYLVGIALHNLPFLLVDQDESNTSFQHDINLIIDDVHYIDMTATSDLWGQNALTLASGFGVCLPDKPRLTPYHLSDEVEPSLIYKFMSKIPVLKSIK